ncbi:Amino oxidase domain-containing protein [Citrus sinensis]|uniref:Amino oxidase domain-containing protein n=1 Tax=Citrus sinensis TaxID=2711 RepID=A0ACB8I437_CITSI|nr:Amino oxidase domain-containing protein [Citrus sinensis]
MRVAVIGGGMSGLVSAYVLAKAGVEVVLYEKEDSLGGHAKTVTIDGVDLDIGFMLFNHVEYPNMMEFLESLGVDMGTSDMSFSVSLDKGQGYEWGTRNGLSSLFAQKKNVLNPYFWQMLREMMKFKDDVLSYVEELENNPDIDRNETLGHFIKSRGYSELFLKAYLIPICSSVWSCPSDGAMRFSAFSVLSFCRLFQLFGHPQCVTVRRHSHSQIDKVSEQLKSWGIQIRMSCEVYSVFPADEGCSIVCENGSQEFYNGCVMAVHAPDALRILGNQATFDETRILGAFRYVYRDVFLHRDKNFMPQNPAAWSAWNFVGSTNGKICLTYCLNVLQPLECLTLQKIGETSMPFLATLNPDRTPQNTLLKWSTGHSVPSVAASKASLELHRIQGKRGIWYSGVYQDWIHSYRLSLSTADVVVEYVKLQHQFTCHCSELLGYGFPEDGLKVGMIAAHGVLGKSCAILGNPKQMVMTQADLGLANSYINGDLSFIDKDEGLLNLFLIVIANQGVGSPMFYTASIASAKYYFRHISRKNTLAQARRNISHHYDVSEYEDLDVAQMRKVSLLIEKARVNKGLDVLEIGCGWGTLAIEIVKQTGCKYTGITLSEEQLKYTETKVKEAGLQDHIRLYLCDYRQMPEVKKYDTIISCEMIENVGHEYIEEFFGCCESLLAEHGLLLLQFSSVPDQCYDGHRLSPGFITEYVFPGGCLPSLNRITSAMTSSSRLW